MVKQLVVNKKMCGWDVEGYFDSLNKKVKEEYDFAARARKVGIDPVDYVEVPLAMTMAEKSVGLAATIHSNLPIKEITNRMLELEEEFGKLDTTVSFAIAKEIAEEKFCKFENQLAAIDAGIRVGFAYLTLGVVASPIEGFTGLDVGKTRDGKDYLIANFSGPIRSAGTTATCVVLMLIDFLREHFGYAKYDPTEEEVKRYITENLDYHERVTNLQYLPTEEEMEFLARRLPIQISGDPTEDKEVSNYKDLERVPTNFIRGGMCLTFSEGLAQKAAKGLKRLNSPKKNGFKCSGWDFLEEYVELHKKREEGTGDVEAAYIKDLVAGRPVYGHPGRVGGFRFRYGRSRVSGFSAASIHPATMGVTDGFLSQGTQLKVEKPTKGCIITSCDSIEGPIVKFKDGSVKQILDFDESCRTYDKIEEIIYLGDILFPLGDVIDRNHELLKPGYVEEWWELELKEKLDVTGEELVIDKFSVPFEAAVELSRKYGVPLHPKYIFYWTQISFEQFVALLNWLKLAVWRGGREDGKLVFPWEGSKREERAVAKRALELLGVEHRVVLDNVVVEKSARAFLFNLGIGEILDGEVIGDKITIPKEEAEVLSIVNEMCGVEIKDKAGTFIGSRMGRPEKAKLRKLTGSPNMLFPVGEQGGRLRSFQDACKAGFIRADWPVFRCECGNETIYPRCEKCGKKTKRMFYCRFCKKVMDSACEEHNVSDTFATKKINPQKYFDEAKKILGKDFEFPALVKGVRGTSNAEHDIEHLAKGILRASFGLAVNKDGTIRYDCTEIPMTHFKPKEIGTSINKLKEMGYKTDIFGEELVSEEQILELKPHDIVLPSCPKTQDEKADDVFFNISKFIDAELEKIYGLPAFYNLNSKEELVGQLVACMAPHNCAG
ncbi:DNA polymerase II large subunit, partial [Candidatus Pacearchaeota archaeon]